MPASPGSTPSRCRSTWARPSSRPDRADVGETYESAGVSIAAGDEAVRRIGAAVASTRRPGVVGDIGSFGGLFALGAAGRRDPLLVSSTDGVGTKGEIARATGRLDTIGIDLVAMCVNDIVCQGAEPLFFLDYFATGKLDVEAAAAIVGGIAEGCKRANCALIGGETAEMPGMYAPGDFDLAGFAVGAMERGGALPAGVAEGDVLLGLASSGFHSNGYSLVRKLVETAGLEWADPAPWRPGATVAEELLEPTEIYVEDALGAMRGGGVHAVAHITGGGLSENLPRVLPEGLAAEIDLGAWDLPAVFAWVRKTGGIAAGEMLKTFNCGIGLVLVGDPALAGGLRSELQAAGRTCWPIGRIAAGEGVRYTGSFG